MSDPATSPASPASAKPPTPGAFARLAIDLGPLVVFFATNAFAPVADVFKIFYATGAFMVAMIAAMISASGVAIRLAAAAAWHCREGPHR